MQERYNQIIELVKETKPSSILEIGVWNGKRAIEMSREALRHQPKVHYQGYDLFEEATARTNEEEFNAKKNNTLAQVQSRLEEFQKGNPGFTFELIRGNTRQTLHEQAVDFAFIDGGHSIETIRSDYEAVKGSTVVLFDDYYKPKGGRCPDTNIFGANVVVDEIPHAKVLPSQDFVKGGGIVALAVVKNKVPDEIPIEPSAFRVSTEVTPPKRKPGRPRKTTGKLRGRSPKPVQTADKFPVAEPESAPDSTAESAYEL